MKRLIIRNKSGMELGVMLEPSTEREDVDDGHLLIIEGEFVDDDLIIDIGDENFVSVWSPPAASIEVK
jgi:hypothetical protein